jgi:hypothetical protein
MLLIDEFQTKSLRRQIDRCKRPKFRQRFPHIWIPRRKILNAGGVAINSTSGIAIKPSGGIVIGETGTENCCCASTNTRTPCVSPYPTGFPYNLEVTISGTTGCNLSCTANGHGYYLTGGGSTDGSYVLAVSNVTGTTITWTYTNTSGTDASVYSDSACTSLVGQVQGIQVIAQLSCSSFPGNFWGGITVQSANQSPTTVVGPFFSASGLDNGFATGTQTSITKSSTITSASCTAGSSLAYGGTATLTWP